RRRARPTENRASRAPSSETSYGHQDMKHDRSAIPPALSSFLRKRCGFIDVPACTDYIVAALARQRGHATGGLVIERQPLELVLFGRRDGDVSVRPSIGSGERFVQYRF